MSSDEFRARSCTSKSWYESRRMAKNYVRTMEKHGKKLTAYHCHFDDHWHVGHAVPKKILRRLRA